MQLNVKFTLTTLKFGNVAFHIYIGLLYRFNIQRAISPGTLALTPPNDFGMGVLFGVMHAYPKKECPV
jgi:hypothetical protein